jgi:flagellar hook-length control protein FliK
MRAPPLEAQAADTEGTPDPVDGAAEAADGEPASQAAPAPTLSPPDAAPTRRRQGAGEAGQARTDPDQPAAPPPAAAKDTSPAAAARPTAPASTDAAKPALDTNAVASEASAAERPEAPRLPEAATASGSANPLAETPAQRDAAGVVRGSPDTVAALTADIARKLEGRSTRFEVELQPAGLGRVEVRIEIGPSGKLTAAFAVDSPQAAAELRGRAPELQRALEQAGFDVSGGLSFDLSDSSRFGRDPEARQDGGAFRGRAFAEALANNEAAELAALPPKLSSRLSAALDIRI